MNPKDRLIVALDVPGTEPARELVSALKGEVGLFKVGLELFVSAGPAFVRELVSLGEKVFLDLKFHDIPTTVAHAVRSARDLGATFVDLHALAGPKALEAAAKEKGGSRLLAITILTSHDERSLAELGLQGPVGEAASRLARLAQEAGADGVVASPGEAAGIRAACGPSFLIVTPGVRPTGADANDQSRLATPSAALEAGADFLVVGRPITQAALPRGAARAIVAEMDGALAGRPPNGIPPRAT
jgi:orotidine-5'-phosphate decarboxylase